MKVTPKNRDSKGRTEQAENLQKRKHRVERATRHDLRIPLRYRLDGVDDWRTGETINISRSGILFYSSEVLEVDVRVEIIFEGSGPLHSNTQAAWIVRRMLS